MAIISTKNMNIFKCTVLKCVNHNITEIDGYYFCYKIGGSDIKTSAAGLFYNKI